MFYLENNEDADEVYVVGNFMGWKGNDDNWRMEFDEESRGWFLKKKKEEIIEETHDLYEFTFIVDGEWIDADKDLENVIHCPGYGYRYTISELL